MKLSRIALVAFAVAMIAGSGSALAQSRAIVVEPRTEVAAVPAPAPRSGPGRRGSEGGRRPTVEAKVEAPKVEAPKVEAPKVEAPKVEAAPVKKIVIAPVKKVHKPYCH